MRGWERCEHLERRVVLRRPEFVNRVLVCRSPVKSTTVRGRGFKYRVARRRYQITIFLDGFAGVVYVCSAAFTFNAALRDILERDANVTLRGIATLDPEEVNVTD